MFSSIVVLIILTTTPIIVQYLEIIGQDKEFSFQDAYSYLAGNSVAWSLILVMIVWSVIWLKIPSEKTYGPTTYYNEKPEFQANGLTYYITSVALFFIWQGLWPQLSSTLFWNMPYIIGALNSTALVFCAYLCAKGLMSPEYPTNIKDTSLFYLFYSGVELHPCVFGMQVKQLTNSRIGLLLWQLLVFAFFITGYQRDGFNYGAFANCILQTGYLAKFYYFEEGYFWTLDVMHDRAGYYLCWGCLVWVPGFLAYSSYYLVLHPSPVSTSFAAFIIVIGVVSILMTFRVDTEKYEFQQNRFNDNFKLWGKKVTYVKVTYQDTNGKQRESRLLTSGCWGVARHLNYLFEVSVTLAWSLPGTGLGLHTFIYVIFLSGLIIHRCYRDEERCHKKYGDGYKKYCERVPYRIIPYIF